MQRLYDTMKRIAMARIKDLVKGSVHERSRERTRAVYQGYELKREVHNTLNYARVQGIGSPLYGGIDPRRRVEMADGGMVCEDQTAMSNLPTEGYQRQYPRTGFYPNPYIQTSVKEE